MKFKLFLGIALVCCFFFACSHNEKLKQGNEIVVKIEQFKSEKGRLPDSLNEIGIAETESGPIYTKQGISFGK